MCFVCHRVSMRACAPVFFQQSTHFVEERTHTHTLTKHSYDYVWSHDTVYDTKHMHTHAYTCTPNYVMEISKWHKAISPIRLSHHCVTVCLFRCSVARNCTTLVCVIAYVHAQNMLQIGCKREISNTSDPKYSAQQTVCSSNCVRFIMWCQWHSNIVV